MSNQRAYRFLEGLQLQTAMALGEEPRPSALPEDLVKGIHDNLAHVVDENMSPEGMAESLDRILGELSANMPTKYENPLTYRIMMGLADRLKKAGEDLEIKPWPELAIGSLRTGQINALTLAIPRQKEYVVAFEDGVFTYALLLSKIIAQTMKYHFVEDGGVSLSVKEEDISQTIAANPEILSRFTEVVAMYAIYGEPSRARQYILPDRVQIITSQLLLNSLELFILGHEYGHAIAGHLSSAKRTASLLPGAEAAAEAEAEEIAYAWSQEHEADYIGMHLAIAAMRLAEKVDVALSFWGADFFFSSMDVMDKAVSLLHFGDETRIQLGSHPPHTNRRDFLRESLRRSAGNEVAEGPIGLGQAIEFAVAELWNLARPIIARMHDEGVRPAKVWAAGEDR